MKMRIAVALVFILQAALIFPCECCEKKTLRERVKNKWFIHDYVLYYFSGENPGPQALKSADEVDRFSQKWKDKVNLQVIKIDSDAEQERILGKYRLKDKTTLLLISPQNKIIWRYAEEKVTQKTLLSLIQSRARKNIISALKREDAALVVAMNKKSKEAKKAFAGIRSAVKKAKEDYGLILHIVKVYTNDKKEDVFLNSMGVADKDLAAAFIFGNGKMLAVLRNNVSGERILEKLEFIKQTCFCTVRPFVAYRHDLLLIREGLPSEEAQK